MASDLILESANPTEAKLATNLLQNAGIQHVVENGSADSYTKVVLGSAFSGLVRILISAADEERARKVFDEAWGETEEPS
jgi:hypothetical protein